MEHDPAMTTIEMTISEPQNLLFGNGTRLELRYNDFFVRADDEALHFECDDETTFAIAVGAEQR